MTERVIEESTRRGITLMEVLIAIGILAIGLTSVAALVPAGGSQARRAIISDRAANIAENALADAVTIGLTRPLSLTGTAARVVIDPAGALALPGASDISLQAAGMLSTATGGGGVPASIIQLFGQGRDDVIFTPSESEDGLPSNLFIDGTRAFDGRTTCLWAIESLDGNSIAAGKLARLSAVVFHERDPSTRTLAASVSATGEVSLTLPADRPIREILKAGTVIVVNPVGANPAILNTDSLLFTLRSASPTGAGASAFGVFDRAPPAASCLILLDSVGLAQAIVTLEGPGPFSLTQSREVTP